MYFYLGGDAAIPEEEVIGVFDMENASTARGTRDFLARAQRAGEVVTVAEDLPRSFAVCGARGKSRVYILQVASATLKKRADQKTIAQAGL